MAIHYINALDEKTYLQIARLLDMSFGDTPPYRTDTYTDQQHQIRRQLMRLRHNFVATVDGPTRDQSGKGEIVASISYHAMTQNLRGNLLKMAGLAGVISHPAARRQGVIRNLIKTAFAHMYENHYALTSLYAFRDSFYGRMGYAQLPAPQHMRFNPSSLAPLLKRVDTTFRWTQFWESNETAVKHSIQYEDYHLRNNHGDIRFDHDDVYRLFLEDSPRWLVSVESEGWAGYMAYHNKDSMMHVSRFRYADADALMWLLTWIARHADQIKAVDIKIAPHERPELWHPDIRPAWQTRDDVPPMTRILNLDAIKHLTFDMPFKGDIPEVTLRIRDAMCPWNNGKTIQFVRVHNGLQMRPVQSDAEAEIDIAGVTAWLFGTHDPAQFKWYGWGDVPHRTILTMRDMMPLDRPYMSWFF